MAKINFDEDPPYDELIVQEMQEGSTRAEAVEDGFVAMTVYVTVPDGRRYVPCTIKMKKGIAGNLSVQLQKAAGPRNEKARTTPEPTK
jgi:hypothetical protein